MGRNHRADVQCPFYRCDDGKSRIWCEGLLDGPGEETSWIILKYAQKADFDIQMQTFCQMYCKRCEIHRILEEKGE